MKLYYDVIQGTDEWNALRLGKFTASCFSDLFAKETTIAYQGLINKVVYERLTGEIPESYSNDYMARGSELESQARQAYELETFNKVKEVGFIEISEWVGCSPDGLIGKDGLVEIKCPKWSTLIDYHLSGKIPSNYMYQMQGQLYVSERQWCDFYVWHPKFKPLLKRVDRAENIIAAIKEKLEIVIAEAEKRICQLQNIK